MYSYLLTSSRSSACGNISPHDSLGLPTWNAWRNDHLDACPMSHVHVGWIEKRLHGAVNIGGACDRASASQRIGSMPACLKNQTDTNNVCCMLYAVYDDACDNCYW